MNEENYLPVFMYFSKGMTVFLTPTEIRRSHLMPYVKIDETKLGNCTYIYRACSNFKATHYAQNCLLKCLPNNMLDIRL